LIKSKRYHVTQASLTDGQIAGRMD